MKKLYIFDEACPGSHYGIGTFIRQLGLALKETDVRLHIIHLSSAKTAFEREECNKITHYYFPPPPTSQLEPGKLRTVYIKSCLYVLLSYLSDNREQIFLFNHFINPECLHFMRELWPQTTLLYVVHIYDPKVKLEQEEKTFLQNVDLIICLSEVTLQKLKEDINIPSTKLKLIYNGREDVYKPVSQQERNALRKTLYIRPEEIVLLFVGRIDMFKGISHVQATFKRLVEWNENCHLFIIGDGAWENYAPQCNGTWGRVSFTGRLKEEQLMHFYQIADVGLLLSYREQCSYVGIEMLMYGIPTIVSAVPGLDEMFEEGFNTIQKVPVSSNRKEWKKESEVIYRTIKNALLNPVQLEQIAEGARKTYCQKYDLSAFKKQYLEVFRSILNK